MGQENMLNYWIFTQEQFYQQHTWTDFMGFPESMSWMIQNTCFISVVVVLPDVKCLQFVTHAAGLSLTLFNPACAQDSVTSKCISWANFIPQQAKDSILLLKMTVGKQMTPSYQSR